VKSVRLEKFTIQLLTIGVELRVSV